jgi:hypothetical protein
VFQLGFVEIDPDGRTITAYNGVAAVVAAPARSQGMLAIQVPPGAAESVIARDIVHVAVMDGVKGTTLAYRPTDTGKSFKTIGNTRNASTDAFHRPDNRGSRGLCRTRTGAGSASLCYKNKHERRQLQRGRGLREDKE